MSGSGSSGSQNRSTVSANSEAVASASGRTSPSQYERTVRASVTTSSERPLWSATKTSASGTTRLPTALRGRRAPFPTASSFPRSRVSSVKTRSASPIGRARSTIASVLEVRSLTGRRRLGRRAFGVVRRRQHADGEDPAPARTVDAQPHALDRVDLLALARQPSEQADDIAADRLELFVRERDPERRVHVFDVRARLDDGLGVADPADGLFFTFVVLVPDLADDLLQEIFHRHEPRRAAVLVDHDRERILAALHLAQQLRDALVLGDERHRPH